MILNKNDYKYYLQQDAIANGCGRYKNLNFLLKIKNLFVPNRILHFLKILRRVEYLSNCGTSPIDKLFLFYYKRKLRNVQLKLGFSIPLNVFGPGLSIPHYGTIIVNQNAKIGAFCRLHACVNIGASGGGNLAPQIGDNCYIGPSTVIFGGIKIANNVTIGANATVNRSFEEDNITIAGTPAKIVKRETQSWVSFNNININDKN